MADAGDAGGELDFPPLAVTPGMLREVRRTGPHASIFIGSPSSTSASSCLTGARSPSMHHPAARRPCRPSLAQLSSAVK